MLYSIVKSLHIIFMVSYFAGIFYLVRLFVYYKDTDGFDDQRKKILREQYTLMIRRLWNIIIVPAAALMSIFGVILIVINPILLKMDWFLLKIVMLSGLAVYHFWSWKKVLCIKSLRGSSLTTKNINLRQANEITAIFLLFIVFTVVLKQLLIDNIWWFLFGFVLFSVITALTVKLVNKNMR